MANNLDLNDKINVGYWILKDPNDYSDTLKAALTLAQNIIESPRSKTIMLTYNVIDSTVDSIIRDLTQNNIEIRQATNEESLNNEASEGAFKPSQPIEIVLSPVLIQLCKNIKEDSLGYNLLIFYIALTILHESRKHWNFKTPKTGELDNDFEGTFQLGADKETKELILTCTCHNQESLLIDSPQDKKFSSWDEELPAVPFLLASLTASSEKLEKVEVDLDILNAKKDNDKSVVHIQLKNSSTKPVKLPKRFSQSLFTCSLISLNSGENVRHLSLCKRSTIMDDLKLVEIEPNESVDYKFEMDSIFDLNSTPKFVSDVYNLRIRFFGILLQERKSVCSNIVQKQLILRHSGQSEMNNIDVYGQISLTNEEMSLFRIKIV